MSYQNMNKHVVCLLLLVLFPCLATAQENITDREKAHDAERVRAVINGTNQPRTTTLSGSLKSVMMTDDDDDGMDDAWEMSNGLDPTDITDGLLDADGDGIYNLFEFQLDTDPNDAAVPVTVDLTPADGNAAILAQIEAAEDSLIVLRLSGGEYTGRLRKFYRSSFRLMIQGGWNEDFTARDLDNTPTVIRNTGGSGIQISQSGQEFFAEPCVFIADGLRLETIDEGVFNASLDIFLDESTAMISVVDCFASSDEDTAFSLSAFDVPGTSFLRMYRCVAVNSGRSGISIGASDDHQIDARLENCTVSNPESTTGGLVVVSSIDDVVPRVRLINSIVYGNGTSDISALGSGLGPTLELLNNNYGSIDLDFNVAVETGTIPVAPLFVDPAGGDFRLQAGSPCIDVGLVLSLPFNGPSPDLGAYEFRAPSCPAIEAVVEEGDLDTIRILGIGGSDAYTYQWVDCATNEDIPGATDSTFIPTMSGMYAAVATAGDCVYASNCISVITTSTTEASVAAIKLFPNPVNDKLYVTGLSEVADYELSIFHMDGRSIGSLPGLNLAAGNNVNVSHLPSGIYLLRIVADQGRAQRSIRWLKQ